MFNPLPPLPGALRDTGRGRRVRERGEAREGCHRAPSPTQELRAQSRSFAAHSTWTVANRGEAEAGGCQGPAHSVTFSCHSLPQ